MYRLTRDDGARLLINQGNWESALEIAYVYGWRPAGTEAPKSSAWLHRRTPSRGAEWDRGDYFSSQSQRVGSLDAQALADAIVRALRDIPEVPLRPDAASISGGAPAATRASARADGMTSHRRNVMSRFAKFADRAGFTIDGE